MTEEQKFSFTVGELIDAGKWIDIAVAAGVPREVAEFGRRFMDRNEIVELTQRQMDKFSITPK